MKRWLVFAVALVVVLLLVRWSTHDVSPARDFVPAPETAVKLRELERAPGAEDERETPTKEENERAALSTRLTVRVFELETRAPIRGWCARLERVPPERDARFFRTFASYGNEHELLQTDHAGTADFDVSPGVVYRLAAWDPDDAEVRERVEVAALAPNERRTVDVPVSTLADRHFCVRALDEETLAPIAGCEVRVVSCRVPPAKRGEKQDPSRAPALLAQAFTAGDGVCEFDLVSRERPRFELVARGYSIACAPVSEDHATRASALEVRLARSARVTGRVLGAPEAGATVVFSARATQLRTPVDAGAGYALQTNPLRTWTSVLDASGRFDAPELPARVSLAVEVRDDGAPRSAFATRLLLAPGEVREVEWDARPVGRIRGRVVDPDGAQVAGVEVWCVRAQAFAHERWVLDTTGADDIAGKQRTDAHGAFTFDDLRPETWLVGVPRAARDDARGTYLGRAELCVVTGDAREHEVVLQVMRALEIRGVLQGPDGQPSRYGYVRAVQAAVKFEAGVNADEQGRFTLGPLLGGSYELTSPSPFLGLVAPIEADAGATDVVLRASPGGGLELRVIADGEPAQRRCVLKLFDGRDENARRFARFNELTDERGVASLAHLAPGTYTAYVSDAGSRFGVARDVVVRTNELTRVDVDTVAGAWLRLLLDRSGERRFVEIEWNGIPIVHASTGEDWDLLERVPAGHLRAVTSRWTGKERETLAMREFDVAVGETFVLDLRELR